MDYAQADALNSAIRALTLRHRARAAELLSRLGLYPGQEFVLMELAAHGPQIQTQLAEAVGCEPPSVTLMVRKLETAGHVARRPSVNDRRATVVELTSEGQALIEPLRDLWRTLAEETVAGITSLPVDQITGLLRELAANVRHGDVRVPAETRNPTIYTVRRTLPDPGDTP